MELTTLRKNMDEANSNILTHKKEAELKLNQLLATFNKAEREYKIALNGVDINRIRRAEEIIFVNGKYGLGDDLSAVNQAIQWFSGSYEPNHYTDLRTVFFGCKNYDRWTHQRNDCEYGYGPSHGSTVFAVGLNKEYRTKELTESEKSDCIYYLEMLKMGKLTETRKDN